MKKVLIVDDDPAILEAIKIAIESEGYSVETEIEGERALDRAKVYLPDLILLDYLLSGIDGGTVTEQIKNSPETRNIPVVILSAHPNAEKSTKKKGADDFLAKPFDLDELLNLVSSYTHKGLTLTT